MSKVAISSAKRADERIANMQWEELVNILEKNYSIKTINKDEVFLNIPGEETADIEILLLPGVDNSFRVQLWNFSLNSANSDDLNIKRCSSVTGVIMAIDDLIRAIKYQKEYR